MTCDAELCLEMGVRNTIDNPSMPRSVGMPAIPRADDVIHSGADRFRRIVIGRRVIKRRAQLIKDVVRINSQVVVTFSYQSGGEFIAGQGLNLMRRCHRVYPAFIWFQLSVLNSEKRDIDRDIVAFEQVDFEMGELWLFTLICEFEPIHPALG